MEIESYILTVSQDNPKQWTSLCTDKEGKSLGTGRAKTKAKAMKKAIESCLEFERTMSEHGGS